MSEEQKKIGKIIGMPADDFARIIKHICDEGLTDKFAEILKKNGHEHVAIEESVFDLIQSSLTTIQCGCKCVGCYNEEK